MRSSLSLCPVKEEEWQSSLVDAWQLAKVNPPQNNKEFFFSEPEIVENKCREADRRVT